MKRTNEQNAAMHLYFRWLAEALREKDYDFRELKVEIPATEELVKELIWKHVQEAMYGKKSTTELDKHEVAAIYDVLNRAFIEKDINVPFPNEEDLAAERFEQQRRQNER